MKRDPLSALKGNNFYKNIWKAYKFRIKPELCQWSIKNLFKKFYLFWVVMMVSMMHNKTEWFIVV